MAGFLNYLSEKHIINKKMPIVNNYCESSIPKRVILTYKSNDPATFTENYRIGYNSIVEYFGAEYEIKLFTDEEMDKIVIDYDKKLFELYRDYPIVIKTDIFRIVALYVYGGYYMDLDIYWKKCPINFLKNIKHDVVFCKEKDKIPQCVGLYKKRNLYSLSNYFMGCTQKNIYFKKLIDNLYFSLDRTKIFLTQNITQSERTNTVSILKMYESKVINSVCFSKDNCRDSSISYSSILMAAGPLYISHIYNSGEYNDEQIYIIDSNTDNTVGEYGIHLLEGSWVNNNNNMK